MSRYNILTLMSVSAETLELGTGQNGLWLNSASKSRGGFDVALISMSVMASMSEVYHVS